MEYSSSLSSIIQVSERSQIDLKTNYTLFQAEIFSVAPELNTLAQIPPEVFAFRVSRV